MSPPLWHVFGCFIQDNNMYVLVHKSPSAISPFHTTDQNKSTAELRNLGLCTGRRLFASQVNRNTPNVNPEDKVPRTYIAFNYVIWVIPYISCQAKVTDFCYSTMSEKNISCCQIPMNALNNKMTNKQSYFLIFMTACCSVTCFLSINLLHYAFCGKLKVIMKPRTIHAAKF